MNTEETIWHGVPAIAPNRSEMTRLIRIALQQLREDFDRQDPKQWPVRITVSYQIEPAKE